MPRNSHDSPPENRKFRRRRWRQPRNSKQSISNSSRPCTGVINSRMSSVSASGSAVKICFNSECRVPLTEKPLLGWKLRNSSFAELCDRCGAAFKELAYCQAFHSNASGWRGCETCGKMLHCGCVASVHAFLLLDGGGIECMDCARQKTIFELASGHIRLPSHASPLRPDTLLNQSLRTSTPVASPTSTFGGYQHGTNLFYSRPPLSGSLSRMQHPGADKMGDKAFYLNPPTNHYMGGMNFGDSHEEKIDAGLKIHFEDRVKNVNVKHGTQSLTKLKEVNHLKGLNILADSKDKVAGEGSSYGWKYEQQNPFTNGSHHFSLKDDSLIHPVPPGPSPLMLEAKGQKKFPGASFLRPKPFQPVQKSKISSSYTGPEITSEVKKRTLPAKVNSQDQCQPSKKNSASVTTPLFEKVLSASDAGRIGRLVLPKKSAEAYFPTISQAEGSPLHILDENGKEWTFHFRFWPNNNSRMYVLEGVTSCIQSMNLQAGDIVTFSRMEPGGKLLMGSRKSSTVISDQDSKLKIHNDDVQRGGAVCETFVEALPVYSPQPVNEAGNGTSPNHSNLFSLARKASPDKTAGKYVVDSKKGRNSGSKRKRLHIHNKESMKLKLTWEEAQEYLHPPPNHEPNIVVIEGYEFEEYEEPPIFGKRTLVTTSENGEKSRWIQCDDCSKWRKIPLDVPVPLTWICADNAWDSERSSCSSSQDTLPKELKDLISTKTEQRKGGERDGESLANLATLANIAVLEDNEQQHPAYSNSTSKHPRHRPGCSCIVCIQPPSGQGNKHDPSCTCNVCQTVKRRFKTLMMRKKMKSEKQVEKSQKNLLATPETSDEKSDGAHKVEESSLLEACSSKQDLEPTSNTVQIPPGSQFKEDSPDAGKGHIDLNCQPDREEDYSPRPYAGSMGSTLTSAMWGLPRPPRNYSLSVVHDSGNSRKKPDQAAGSVISHTNGSETNYTSI